MQWEGKENQLGQIDNTLSSGMQRLDAIFPSEPWLIIQLIVLNKNAESEFWFNLFPQLMSFIYEYKQSIIF